MKIAIRLWICWGAALCLAACSGSGTSQGTRCSPAKGFYCVKAGDNLYRIGLRFGVSVNQLKSWNNLRGDRVAVGQKLRVGRGASSARSGAPVLAAAAGQVVYIGTEVRGYPNLILIRHNAALITAYSNNAGVLVSNNARVAAGQQIATMSSSFQSNEGLLHFEVRENGKAVNPRDYLR